ncbi:NAD-dependent epimerase/dehydratase family protein [Segetibacter sp. 3557_3]|uniref:GDP-mannose 4,6-dehydratase n=1 Tax=Segetibacter sp. 3557_3 TaxID=2547429 RepID=UPI0010585E28|nr:GDP-mannose 4,6-dehydratase [Segetibacter sp. 3557_3]TDH25249.1 NAD-dependent epimerase/dehydratase family protein [Segetibacter sp. 3557_3]
MEDKKELVGLVQWFQVGEYEAVEKAISDFKRLGLTAIRTNFSWADWRSEGGKTWYDWLFPTLAKDFQILPCLFYTTPFTGTKPNIPAEPQTPKDYAEFIDSMLEKYGDHFEYLELWYGQNKKGPHNYTADEKFNAFCEIAGNAAARIRNNGKKTVLGGICAENFGWLPGLFSKKLMQYIDVLGFQFLADDLENRGENINTVVSRLREMLELYNSPAQIWITEAGCSTWQKTGSVQVREFIAALHAPCDRLYWYALNDVSPALFGGDVSKSEYYFGMKDSSGSPKLLYTLLASKGLDLIDEYGWITEDVIGRSSRNNNDQYTLITGGSGFVGVNLADRLLSEGKKVMVFDNLSRSGVENNLFWLKDKYKQNLQIMIADIRDKAAVNAAVANADQVFHFAAQVAVTSSLENPFYDFEVNAQGTLNLLEAIRNTTHQPPVVFTSTNKVYGGLDDLGIVMNGTRYYPENTLYRQNGISENRNLEFHSPYGCTKGVADQYMLDYARTFGLKTVVFRMSCIYGPHQFGTEDQGWVAHFLIQAMKNKPITLYGDGKQVRDVLFVEDLVNAFILAMDNIDVVSGQAFNMGGGVNNTVSLLELCDLIGDIAGKKPEVRFDDWRPSDQKYYVSDFTKFNGVTGWAPNIDSNEGVQRLYHWLIENAGIPVVNKTRKQKIITPA